MSDQEASLGVQIDQMIDAWAVQLDEDRLPLTLQMDQILGH